MLQWEKEREVVRKSSAPVTATSIARDLEKLGLGRGDVVFVHSSLSSLGWVVGASQAVIDALTRVLGAEGTLVMPAFTTGNTDPRGWNYPPVPESWWPTIREEMPPFRSDASPVRGLGRIPETFRKYQGVLRSSHPQLSFCAWGQNAEAITAEQPLASPFGRDGPLGKLYDLKAFILLLGVGHSSNTSLHLAEQMAALPNHPVSQQGAAILEDGLRVWKRWEQKEDQSDDFEELGSDFEEAAGVESERVGEAESRLIEMKVLVDFGVQWLKEHRHY
jgi:aminoglycoside 3-N-acetyltransferase